MSQPSCRRLLVAPPTCALPSGPRDAYTPEREVPMPDDAMLLEIDGPVATDTLTRPGRLNAWRWERP